MTNARDKANIPVLNFQSKGIDDNADATAVTINSSEQVGIGTSSFDQDAKLVVVGSGNGGSNPSSINSNTIATFRRTGGLSHTAIISVLGGSSASSILNLGDRDDEDVGNITYAHSSNHMAFTTGASERMRLNSTGLGVGTSSPTTTLDVNLSGTGETVPIVLSNRNTTAGTGQKTTLGFGLARNSGAFKSQAGTIEVGREQDWTSADSNIDSYMAFSTYLNNAGTEKMRIDSSGNVGIATTSIYNDSQHGKLAIAGKSGTAAGILIFQDTSNNEDGMIFADDGNLYIVADRDNTATSSSIIFRIDGSSEKMRINSSGNVGIGTTSPEVPLSVVGLDTQIQFGEVADAGGYLMSEADGQFRISGGAGFKVGGTGWRAKSTEAVIIGHDSGGDIKFFSNTGLTVGNSFTPSERMRIDGSGNVGIGTSSPNNQLEIKSDTATVVTRLACNTGTGRDWGVASATDGAFGIYDYDASAYRMRINSSGHVTAPNLNTTGSTSNRYPLYWVHSGTTGSIEPYTGSIRAMKTDITNMSSVDWIYSLTPRSFKFRDYEIDENGNRTYLETTNNLPNIEYGLIAEEVNEVNGSDYILDKQIDEDGNENVKGVLYHNLVPILLKAVQEQQTKIQELEARITTLEANNP